MLSYSPRLTKGPLQNERKINCLFQIHVAEEATKFGWGTSELLEFLDSGELKKFENVNVCGIMGMATNTADESIVRREFHELKTFFDLLHKKYFSDIQHFIHLSMGMSGDYTIAIEEGSNMVRIGSAIFGARN